jgi:hypothetical protein
VRALSHVLFFFNPGPVWRVPIPNRYTAKAKLCFCKNNKRTIIIITFLEIFTPSTYKNMQFHPFHIQEYAVPVLAM